MTPRDPSTLQDHQQRTQLTNFSDALDYMERKRHDMVESGDFFKTMKDTSIPVDQKMLFVPYMLPFPMGFPDTVSLTLRADKNDKKLSEPMVRINKWLEEDDFHYNFYLHDLEALGYSMDKFGSTSAVIRHVYAEESQVLRRLNCVISYYCIMAKTEDKPLIALALIEAVEGAISDFFKLVYTNCYQKDPSLSKIEYYGDKHVLLEQSHEVTNWFADGQEEDVFNPSLDAETGEKIAEMIDHMFDGWSGACELFNKVIIENKQTIYPEKYLLKTDPTINKITTEKL